MKTRKKSDLVAIKDLPNSAKLKDVNDAAIMVGKMLRLHGASVGDFDLYRLLQAYVYDEQKRRKINLVIQSDAMKIPNSAYSEE
jgi:hypothetical protein